MFKINEEGFLLIEMLICLALTTMMVTICLPIINQLKLEQKIIANRVDVYHYLYNEIQMIDLDQLPVSEITEVDTIALKMIFYQENDLIVGQGDWKNVKDQFEQVFVYFKPPN
ncbi:MAG TPA: hypothetical protein GXZ58_04515 [Bacilli bacterium]|nr:hypothetical protein [Bacilli bacterium]